MIIPSDISSRLQTDFIGRDIRFFDLIQSTNLTAREMAEMNTDEGAAVIAEAQNAGKGRAEKKWYSPPGKNIYTSLVLRPPIKPFMAFQLTLVAAVALKDTIAQFTQSVEKSDIEVKWPNDILISGKKCAGILMEMKSLADNIEYIILGVGVNVNMKRDDMADEIADTATSLFISTGKEFTREPIVACLYLNIEKWYKRYLKDGFEPARNEWLLASAITGRRVKAVTSYQPSTTGNKPEECYEEGTAIGIDNNGVLILRKDEGEIVKVIAGDIVLKL